MGLGYNVNVETEVRVSIVNLCKVFLLMGLMGAMCPFVYEAFERIIQVANLSSNQEVSQ